MTKTKTKKSKTDVLDEISVTIEAVLSHTKMTVGEFRDLEENSTIKLDASLNELVELKLNGQLVARGELVNVNDNYGVKITQLSNE